MKTIVPFCVVMLISSVSAVGGRYFHIQHVKSRTYLQVEPNAEDVKIRNGNGKLEQMWFWDGDYLRNRKWPYGVLAFDTGDYLEHKNSHGIGRVVLHFHVHGGNDLRWKYEDGTIKTKRTDRVDDVRLVPYLKQKIPHFLSRIPYDGGNGCWVGGKKWDGSPKFIWKVMSDFYIKHIRSGKYLQVESNAVDIKLRNKNRQREQMWFWDGDLLRSRKFLSGFLLLDQGDYRAHSNIGRVILHHHMYSGPDDDRRWKFEDGTFKCKKNGDGIADVRLVPYNRATYAKSYGRNGDFAGGMKWDRSVAFKWTLQGV